MKELLEEAQQIQDFMEISVGDDPTELTNRLSDINTYMARTGKMLADAKQFQDNAISTAYGEHSKEIMKMPATIASKFISSQCGDVNYLVNWLDRLNRTCVHQGDNIRTQLSFIKEQLSLTRKGY